MISIAAVLCRIRRELIDGVHVEIYGHKIFVNSASIMDKLRCVEQRHTGAMFTTRMPVMQSKQTQRIPDQDEISDRFDRLDYLGRRHRDHLLRGTKIQVSPCPFSVRTFQPIAVV